LKTLAALGYLIRLLFTPAKAFPIASQTPDATGAMTAAVIASVMHDLDLTRETIGRAANDVKPLVSSQKSPPSEAAKRTKHLAAV
jgi:hypothetical protein